MKTLAQKIDDRSAIVGVIGLGYVGLPLVVEFARNGFRVLGVDVDGRKVEAINQGRSYIQDVPGELLRSQVEAGLVSATTDFDRLAEADAMSICVPTPLGKTKDPDMSFVVAATESVAKRLRPGQLIVLESTTYPGTTEELLLPVLSRSGLRVGEDFFLAFSPERVDPGNPVYGVRNTPKVVGGVTPVCTEMAVRLYATAIERVLPVSSTAAAETVKLLENTFRSVNIGLVNEIAIMCDRLKLDVWEVIDAASSKPFGFMPFYPGPGLGGHCIPIDPLYLSWKMKALNYRARFIELASEVNASMPEYVVSKVVAALNRVRKAANGSRILVIGVAYKRNIDDTRESPALDIVKLLRGLGAEVDYHDPHVPVLRIDGVVLESRPLEAAGRDLAVIATDHGGIDWAAVVDAFPLVVDARNATKGLRSDKVVRL
ncbi:MAG: nucleotide sugar dehydrogenase [Planctomycetes bacterium]|nr:nucleotide sugar dehydrogenase [Planctomycetota bacterium]